MKRVTIILLCAVALVAGARTAAAGRRARVLHRGRSVVLVSGAESAIVLYRSQPRERVIAAPVWSRAKDAVAFATRDRRGVTLVVVLITGAGRGPVLRWRVPRSRRRRHRHRRWDRPIVTWLGPQRVAYGRGVRSDVVASWRTREL